MKPLRTSIPLAPPSLRLFFVPIGMLGVGSIALHAMGWLPLQASFFTLVLPTLAFALLMSTQFPDLAQDMWQGWIWGFIAVACYDLSRWPFVWLGWWGDFIPSIGAWLLERNDPHAGLGYLWRYAANGGGLGVAFFVGVLPMLASRHRLLGGTLFGVGVFGGLMATICLAPHGEQMLFELSPTTITGSLLGHVVYGSILGLAAQKWTSRPSSHKVTWFRKAQEVELG